MSDPALATTCDFRNFLSSVEAYYDTKNTTSHAALSASSGLSSASHSPDDGGVAIYLEDTSAASPARVEDVPAERFHDVGTSPQTPAQTLAQKLPPEANVSFIRYEQDVIKPNEAETLTAFCRHNNGREAADHRSNEKVVHRYSREFLIHFRSHGVSPSSIGGITAAIKQAAAKRSPQQAPSPEHAQSPGAGDGSCEPEMTWHPDDSFARDSRLRPNFLCSSIQARRSTGSATGALR
ncbi:hypothetical protein BGZ68_008526 [Mortierella alpina]|nr:hypothetical protein BGZ68_008526 [Mortierella alpina]